MPAGPGAEPHPYAQPRPVAGAGTLRQAADCTTIERSGWARADRDTGAAFAFAVTNAIAIGFRIPVDAVVTGTAA